MDDIKIVCLDKLKKKSMLQVNILILYIIMNMKNEKHLTLI